MSLLKIPVKNALKSCRVPNAFTLYVKKKELVQKYPEDTKNVMNEFLGKKWHSLQTEEKQVYYHKYNAVRNCDNSVFNMKNEPIENEPSENEPETITDGSLSAEISETNPNLEQKESNNNRRKSDETFTAEEPDSKIKKCKSDDDAIPSTSKNSLPLVPFLKPKTKRRFRRPPNPFMIFAKEQRNSVSLSPPANDKKCHASTILGNMWKELSDEAKSKYIEEAKRQHDLMKSELVFSSARTKPSKDTTVKKPVGRPPKKPKELIAAHIPILRSMNNGDSDRKLEDSASNIDHHSGLGNIENGASNNGFPEFQVSSELSNNVNNQQINSARSHFHHLPQQTESHQSKNCFCWNHSHNTNRNNNDVSLRQYSLPDGAIARSYAGTGFVPPLFMQYPMYHPHFWLHEQMIHQMYMQNFSHSYCCGFPYNYHGNMYINSYVFPRHGSMSSNPIEPTYSVAGNSSNRDESVEACARDEKSDDELLVVDEDRSHQPSDNGIDHQG